MKLALVLTWVVLSIAILLIIIVAGIIQSRTKRIKPQSRTALHSPLFNHDKSLVAATHLSEAIRFQTISHSDVYQRETREWIKLREYFRITYPLVHKTLDREIVNGFSLIYKWSAENPIGEPLMFCGHLDVVPVAETWTHPPFSGKIADGYVWGRGAIDCKSVVVSLLETIETLIASGFEPKRDMYFAFGHDEEVGGQDGAKAFAKTFFQNNIHFHMILDEGTFISNGILPTGRPVAHIGVTEKGYMNCRMSVSQKSGHSSTPPQSTAIGRLGEAMARIEFAPRQATITPIVAQQLLILAPDLSIKWRRYIANQWLFKKKIIDELSSQPATNALIRTTIVPTMTQSGLAPNVLPHTAESFINVRLLNCDSEEATAIYLQNLTADLGTTLEVLKCEHHSEISDYTGEVFDLLKESIKYVFTDIPVVPSIMTGGTDARNYENFSSCVYRFSPFILTADDLDSVHSNNEKILIDSLGAAICFYTNVIQRFNGYESADIPAIKMTNSNFETIEFEANFDFASLDVNEASVADEYEQVELSENTENK